MSRVTKLITIVVVTSLISILMVIVIARSSRTARERKITLIQKVKQSPDIPINFTNFDGVPLRIERAVTKEISATDYQQLIGGDLTGADRFATFPSITLLNVTNQRVATLMVTVGSRQTKKWYVVNFRQANIAPGQAFSITAADWHRDKKSKTGNDNNTETAPSKVTDFDAGRLWWPSGARADDLVFRIALVEFEDGKKWEVDKARGSLW